MIIKNEKGVTLAVLAIVVILLAIISVVTIGEIGNILNKVEKETIITDMLLMQAKAKVLEEKANFSNDETLLKGQKLSEITGNAQINALKTNGVISESEEQYAKYYMWNKQTIEELEISVENVKDGDIYVVNYATEEVIYAQGYEHTNGNTYYKLSEISELE